MALEDDICPSGRPALCPADTCHSCLGLRHLPWARPLLLPSWSLHEARLTTQLASANEWRLQGWQVPSLPQEPSGTLRDPRALVHPTPLSGP